MRYAAGTLGGLRERTRDQAYLMLAQRVGEALTFA
jgi:hypothetical protein